MLSKSQAQALALTQNELLPDFKGAEAAIKAAAGSGLFSAEYTVTDLDFVVQVTETLKVNGFSVTASGDDDEILAISFGA